MHSSLCQSSASMNSAAISNPLAPANATMAARCASSPSPALVLSAIGRHACADVGDDFRHFLSFPFRSKNYCKLKPYGIDMTLG